MQARALFCGSHTGRLSRRLVPLFALGVVTGILGCRDQTESPTAPESAPALATTASTALAFSQVSAGTGFHTCGVTTDGRAYCWGANFLGQLGDGTTAQHLRPVAVAGGLRFRQVSVGEVHTCGVTTDDQAYCWGGNSAGQLGDGTLEDCGGFNPPCTDPPTTANRLAPVPVLGGLQFRQVDAGLAHTCGVTAGGRAYCWGVNSYGQLGNGAAGDAGRSTDRPTPVAVVGGHIFRQVSAGISHTCGVTPTNQAFCWGDNRAGELGDGTNVRISIRPVLVAGGHLFVRVSAGGQQEQGVTCGVTTIDRAFCWGYGRLGQIGDGKTNNRYTPRAVAGRLSFRQVSAGVQHTCGVTTGDRSYCWGTPLPGAAGGLGDGTTAQRLKPVAVLGGLDFSRVSAGGFYTCGSTLTAKAYCWGFNFTGQLGDGTRRDRLTPRAVVGP